MYAMTVHITTAVGNGLADWLGQWRTPLEAAGTAIIVLAAILFAYSNIIAAMKAAKAKQWSALGKELGAIAVIAIIAGIGVVGLFAAVNALAPDVLPNGTTFNPVS